MIKMIESRRLMKAMNMARWTIMMTMMLRIMESSNMMMYMVREWMIINLMLEIPMNAMRD